MTECQHDFDEPRPPHGGNVTVRGCRLCGVTAFDPITTPRPPMTAAEREQFIADNLAKQLIEARNLARWSVDFLPKDSPGRLAAEAVMAEWGEQWSTPKPEGAT